MSSPRNSEAALQSTDRSIKIEVTTSTSQPALLKGLSVWMRLGLLSQTQIKVEVTTKASHPELLKGLDAFLRLGLLPESLVKQLCQENLTCPLPQEIATPAQTPTPLELPDFATDFAPEEPAEPIPRQSSQSPSWITEMLQSLQAELSVRWLLFLGVFMVVVSSGVLAASQWRNFPASGQYGVLLGYTLTFWAVCSWANRQSNLRLTAQTLQIVTLLLVPVNFWAMDGFRLWRNPIDWIVVAVATVVLSAIAFSLWKREQQPPLPIINYLALSYLHWGWSLPGFPLVAIYLGTGATLATFYWECRKHRTQATINSSQPSGKVSSYILHPATFQIAVYGIGILLFRGIFVVGVDIQQLGLAIGAYGWFLSWLSQQQLRLSAEESELPQFSWEWLGGGLLFLGWLVSVGVDFPWQAIAVSGLGLWFFSSRLQRFWQRLDLLAILCIGLQSIGLSWRLIPSDIQTQLVATASQLTGSQDTAFAVLSLVLFPYLVFIVGLIDWLDRRQKTHLAEFGEAIALSFGTLLTVISSVNPLLRTLNLLNSTITLGIVTRRRGVLGITRNLEALVYLTHITGIVTILCAIDYLLPNLNRGEWAAILLALMLGEWAFSLESQETGVGATHASPVQESGVSRIAQSPIWRSSAWHLGLALAGLSYALLWMNYQAALANPSVNVTEWGLLWLITPLSVTGVANQTSGSRRQLASGLSVAALVAVQFLTLSIPHWRLVSLAVATILMLVNTRYLRTQNAATITVGFGLSFLGMFLWEGVPGLPRLSLEGWLVAGAIALTSLWLLRSWLIRRATELAPLYVPATDGWAIALCSVELILLTLHSLAVYWGFISPAVAVLIAGIVTMGAIAYRSWRHPSNWSIYALGWCLELLTAEGLGFIDRSVLNLAIANLALGLLAQLIGDWWQRRAGISNVPNSWHVIPLLYGILGALLRWGTFANWTGLSTLALALIAIGVGRRRQKFKPLIYLALLGVSVSAYEVLLYQLSQLSGGSTGDGLIVMAALGTSIMYAYRVLSPWLSEYLHLTKEELKAIAHLHWAWSSILLMIATTYQPQSLMLGFGVGVFLVQYAIFQGRNNPPQTPPSQEGASEEEHINPAPYPGLFRGDGEIWVYLGFLEAVGMRLYWLSLPVARLLSGPLGPWKGAIASVFAYFLFILPWQRWGWSKRPWTVAAVAVPLIAFAESPMGNHPISLLIVTGYYVFFAILNQQIRFTYISALLIDWVLYRWFWPLGLRHSLWYVTPLALSLLYIAQVDPNLKQPQQKPARHLLRLLGSGAICSVALWSNQWSGLVPGVISLLVIFAGLGLRVRAFLYVGTATFLVNAFYQLGILIFDYPFSKWVIGLLVGIAFIWIAATFETRREQITALLRNWITELQNWE
ncbi:MAG TPA: hypothetical protein V6D30_10200 [Leptolyngbyaceae cyanobacterium]